jgi:hypothetical protein
VTVAVGVVANIDGLEPEKDDDGKSSRVNERSHRRSERPKLLPYLPRATSPDTCRSGVANCWSLKLVIVLERSTRP